MPLSTTWTAIDLGFREYGNGAPFWMDTAEGNGTSEAAYDLVGATFGNAAEPLYDKLVTIDASNPNGIDPTELLQNNYQGGQFYADTFTADFGDGNGPQTYEFDALTVYNATVTFRNGETANVTAVVFQSYDGRLFLAPEFSQNSDSTIYNYDGIRSFTITDVDQNTGIAGLNTTRVGGEDGFVCFAAGTLIDTPNGPLRVEDLRPGDAVTTLDQGAQPLVWTGRRALSAAELAANPNWQPIRIPAGALGAGLPHRDLLVSPQHRVMIASRAVQRLFDRPQVLVAATHLQGVNGIARLDTGAVTYHHIMCRSHQIVLSEGAPTETLYAGKMALAGLPADSRAELLSLFPELADTDPAPMAPARDFLTGRQGRKAAAAHQRKARPLLESWLRG